MTAEKKIAIPTTFWLAGVVAAVAACAALSFRPRSPHSAWDQLRIGNCSLGMSRNEVESRWGRTQAFWWDTFRSRYGRAPAFIESLDAPRENNTLRLGFQFDHAGLMTITGIEAELPDGTPIIVAGMQQRLVARAIGQPSKVYSCADTVTWVYQGSQNSLAVDFTNSLPIKRVQRITWWKGHFPPPGSYRTPEPSKL